MKFNWKKALSGACAALIAVTSFASPVAATSYPAIGSKPDSQPERPIEHGIKSIYPVNAGKTVLTYWCELQSNPVGAGATNLGQTAWAKTYEKATGIKLEYVGQPTSGAQTVFNTLVAGKNLPDIVEEQWDNWYGGGTESAIKQKKIISLAPEIKKGNDGLVPFYAAYLKDNPSIDKQVKTEAGEYGVFPFIRPNALLQTSTGPIVRKDWLDDLKLAVPETIADWETMLIAFKEKKNAKGALAQYTGADANPAGGLLDIINSAYGFRSGIYVDADRKTVKYGEATTGYRDALTLLNKWYKAGLIDADFPTRNNRNDLAALIYNYSAGATLGRGGGDIGEWNPTQQAKDKNFLVVGAKFPVLKKGDKIQYSQGQNLYNYNSVGNAAISYNSKNQKLAMQLLDYAYSPAGHVTFNFGEKGVSYNLVDGKEVVTDLILNNKAGDTNKTKALTIAQAWSWYARGNYNGPFVQDPGYILQFYTTQVQKDALTAWTTVDNVDKTIYPPTAPTSAEQKIESSRKTAIQTYAYEMTTKFILGREPIANWDKYVKNLNDLGLQSYIKSKQDAYNRYMKK